MEKRKKKKFRDSVQLPKTQFGVKEEGGGERRRPVYCGAERRTSGLAVKLQGGRRLPCSSSFVVWTGHHSSTPQAAMTSRQSREGLRSEKVVPIHTQTPHIHTHTNYSLNSECVRLETGSLLAFIVSLQLPHLRFYLPNPGWGSHISILAQQGVSCAGGER